MEQASKEFLYVALQQMFPTSSGEKVDEVKALTESYHKYKMEYLKHLSFNLPLNQTVEHPHTGEGFSLSKSLDSSEDAGLVHLDDLTITGFGSVLWSDLQYPWRRLRRFVTK